MVLDEGLMFCGRTGGLGVVTTDKMVEAMSGSRDRQSPRKLILPVRKFQEEGSAVRGGSYTIILRSHRSTML